jgi:hypothetical protein
MYEPVPESTGRLRGIDREDQTRARIQSSKVANQLISFVMG